MKLRKNVLLRMLILTAVLFSFIFFSCSKSENPSTTGKFKEVVLNLKSQDVKTRIQAADTLSQTGDKSVLPFLMEAAEDSVQDVRCHSMNALARLGDSSVIPFAKKRINAENEQDRADGVALLANIGKAEVMSDMLELIEKEKSRAVKYNIYQYLTVIKDKKALPVVQKLLETGDDFDKSNSALILGYQMDNSATPSLIKAANDKSPSVRLRAIWALGTIKDSSGFPAIKKALNDENPQVADMAKAFIKQLETEEKK